MGIVMRVLGLIVLFGISMTAFNSEAAFRVHLPGVTDASPLVPPAGPVFATLSDCQNATVGCQNYCTFYYFGETTTPYYSQPGTTTCRAEGNTARCFCSQHRGSRVPAMGALKK